MIKKIPDWSKFAPSNFSDIRGLISIATAFISALIVGHIILEEYAKTLFYKIDFSHIEISSEKQIPFYIVVILVGFLAVFTNYFVYCSLDPNTRKRTKLDNYQFDVHMSGEKIIFFSIAHFLFLRPFTSQLFYYLPQFFLKIRNNWYSYLLL